MGTETKNSVLDRVKLAAGGGAALSRSLGLKSKQAVYMWDQIPIHHVLKIEKLFGVPRHEQRPDFYPPPRSPAA